MFISADILRQIYPTLARDHERTVYLRATSRTCDLFTEPDDDCLMCPFYSGDPTPGHSCALSVDDNPNLIESWSLFYEANPEYLI